jgi:hypothetical protein
MNPMMIVNPMAGMYGQMPLQQQYPYQQSYMQPQYQQQQQQQQASAPAAATGDYDPNVYAQWFISPPPSFPCLSPIPSLPLCFLCFNMSCHISHFTAGTTITLRTTVSHLGQSTRLLEAQLRPLLPPPQTQQLLLLLLQMMSMPLSQLAPSRPSLQPTLRLRLQQRHSASRCSWIEAPARIPSFGNHISLLKLVFCLSASEAPAVLTTATKFQVLLSAGRERSGHFG